MCIEHVCIVIAITTITRKSHLHSADKFGIRMSAFQKTKELI